MRRYLYKFAIRCKLRLWRKNEIARVDGIVLVDLRENSPRFRDCMLAALELVKSYDPLRFRRIQRRLSWVVNCTLLQPAESATAEYHHDTRSCEIDFDDHLYDADPEWCVVWFGSLLVHEATHGTIRAHGILYTPELRSRIERLCVAEEHRFLDRLSRSQPEVASRVRGDFDESDWYSAWNATIFERLSHAFRRLRAQH